MVENRPGGGGVTAAVAVAHAPPDGYTIMMASSTILAINVGMRKNLPYDPRKDLQPISLLARVPFVLLVNPALPVHSVADLVRLAKEKPGTVSFGTPGPGTFHHLNGEMFKGIFGLQPRARALQGLGARAQRRRRRPYPDDVLRPAARACR